VKIGIIGSGKIGAGAARLFIDAGHEVAIANSRGPESLADLVSELGEGAQAGTLDEAAAFGELVLVATPFAACEALPAGALAGKTVLDAMNYYPARDGEIAELESGETTSSEMVAAHLPGASVVKAFNTMHFKTLAEAGGQGLVLFIAGDDKDAKQIVSGLIEEIGFVAVDTGSLAEGGRLQQPGSAIYNEPMDADEARRALSQAA
jgi:predicted dinucleotide-binding enzyme